MIPFAFGSKPSSADCACPEAAPPLSTTRENRKSAPLRMANEVRFRQHVFFITNLSFGVTPREEGEGLGWRPTFAKLRLGKRLTDLTQSRSNQDGKLV